MILTKYICLVMISVLVGWLLFSLGSRDGKGKNSGVSKWLSGSSAVS